MIDRSFIKKQIESLVETKNYDKRAKPMLVAYFTLLSERNKYTEAQLEKAIETYKSKVDQISYYNIGITNFMYTSEKELIFDREIVEGLDETNIEKFLQSIVRGNSIAMFGSSSKGKQNITDMSSQANLYEYVDDMYVNINDMIASAFAIKPEEVPGIHDKIFEKLYKIDIQRNPKEYRYLSDATVILPVIDDRVKDIMGGKNIKDAYKAIYTAGLLNLKIKICDLGLIDENSGQQCAQLLKRFEQYREILGIQEGELEAVVLDGKDWRLNANALLKQLQEKLKTITKSDRSDEQPTRREILNRKQILQEQAEENSKVDRNITEEYMQEKVNALIEKKNYPREFDTILHEFFRRSAEEFEWDRETLDKKIENLSRNVDSFEYVKNNNLNILATSNALNKSIDINSLATLFTTSAELSAILLHELKHATDRTERGDRIEDSFKPVDSNNIDDANGLNELVTEASTIRILGKNPYSDSLATTYKLEGYEELSFATSMISSAIGLTEGEFLRLASKGEEKFKENLETRYPGLQMSQRVDEIQEALTYMYYTKGVSTEQSIAEGYAELYKTLSNIYETRTDMEKREGRFDPIKARYDEYRINKNMLLAQRKLWLPKKVLRKEIPETYYGEIAEKARLTSDERRKFKEIGREMKSDIKPRDNRNLVSAGREIKRYRRNFSNTFFKKKKLISAPEQKNNNLKQPERSFEEERKQFLQGVHQNVDISQAQTNPSTPENPRQVAQGLDGQTPEELGEN